MSSELADMGANAVGCTCPNCNVARFVVGTIVGVCKALFPFVATAIGKYGGAIGLPCLKKKKRNRSLRAGFIKLTQSCSYISRTTPTSDIYNTLRIVKQFRLSLLMSPQPPHAVRYKWGCTS